MIVNNRYTLRRKDGLAKFYVWKTIRDLNNNSERGSVAEDLRIEPDELLVAADQLDELGSTDVAAFLRQLATPRKPLRRHARTYHVFRDGHTEEVDK